MKLVRLEAQAARDRHRRTYSLNFPAEVPPDQVIGYFNTLSGLLRPNTSAIGDLLNLRDLEHTFRSKPSLVLETWGTGKSGLRWFVAIPFGYESQVRRQLESLVPGVQLTHIPKPSTRPWNARADMTLHNGHRPLKLDDPISTNVSLRTAFGEAGAGEALMMQIILTPMKSVPLPEDDATSVELNLSSLLHGTKLSKAELYDRRKKLSEKNFLTAIRVVAAAKTDIRASFLLNHVTAVLKSTDNGNTYFKRRSVSADAINHAVTPLSPGVQLTASELACLTGWHLGTMTVFGQQTPASRRHPTPNNVPKTGRVIGESNYSGRERKVAQPYSKTSFHTHIIGATGCIHPDTPIYDPVDDTTITVKQRWEMAKPFHVYAMRGTELVVSPASPPVEFRKVGMYRLYNAQHEIFVTGQHRVWNGQVYVEVEKLYQQQQSAQVLLPSISDADLSRLRASGLSCLSTVLGSQDGRHQGHHSCGVQLPPPSDSGQASAPSLIGGVGHTLHELQRVDDQVRTQGHNQPCLQSHRSSRSSSSRQVNLHYVQSHRPVSDTSGSPLTSCPSSTESDAGSNRLGTVSNTRQSEPGSTVSCCGPVLAQYLSSDTDGELLGSSLHSRQLSDKSSAQHEQGAIHCQFGVASEPYKTPFDEYFKINTFWVEPAMAETYYDFHVPELENYLASGLIHHNSGKSTLMANMAKQDMENGYGLVVIDSKDLVDKILNYVPPERIDDVVVVDLHDPSRVVGFNYLQEANPRLVTSELTTIFSKLFAGSTTGLWLSDVIRHGVPTLLHDPDSTLMDLLALFSPDSDQVEWRDNLIRQVEDPFLKAYWQRIDNMERTRQDQRADPMLTRFGPLTDPSIRNVLGQSRSSFKMSDVVKNNMILCINLGGVDKAAAAVLGTLFINSLWNEIQANRSQKGIQLYVDEFQRVVNIPVDTESMFAEARSMGLHLNFAHQQLGQITDTGLRQSIMTNARSKFVMNVSKDDARAMADELGAPITPHDLINLQSHEMVARVMTDDGPSSPFTLKTLEDAQGYGQASRIRYTALGRYSRPVYEVIEEMAAKNRTTTRPTRRPQTPSGWGSL